MSRPAKLEPYRSNGSWVLSIPPSLSKNGKRQRKFFKTKEDADKEATRLKTRIKAGTDMVHRAGDKLIQTAVHYHEIFRDEYGFEGGLEEACEKLIEQLDTEHNCMTFGELLDEYEQAKACNWKSQYTTTWKTFRSLTSQIEGKSNISLGTDFWRKWLEDTTMSRDWAARTFNDYTSMLSSVWKFAVKTGRCEKNPIDGITRKKIPRTEVAIYSIEQVKAILVEAWEHDQEMVPFFAIAIFAGVRPDVTGEMGKLTWDDVNFEEKWIRVGTNFDNKTNTKRFVPIEDNLLKWLLPWVNAKGGILPSNFVKRRRYLTRGKYRSPQGTPETEWIEVVPYGHPVRDITRHTYGSYLEAKYRNRHVVKENMGHADFTTYEQHYRNARTPKEAEEFWSIIPDGEE